MSQGRKLLRSKSSLFGFNGNAGTDILVIVCCLLNSPQTPCLVFLSTDLNLTIPLSKLILLFNL